MALSTPLTELFKIKHPVMLAGMAGAAGPELAAAVSNAGGLGNIGGLDGLKAMWKQVGSRHLYRHSRHVDRHLFR